METQPFNLFSQLVNKIRMTKKKANPQKAGRKPTGNRPIWGRVSGGTFDNLPQPHSKTVSKVVEAYVNHEDVKQLIDSKNGTT